MKVGLIGFFGVGAYSDDLIEHVTKKLLLKHSPEAQIGSRWRMKCARGTNPRLLNSFDLLVQAGGSLLGKCSHYPIRDIDKWYDKVNTPLAIFGTGYRYEPDKEPLNAMRRRRLQLLFEKAEVISVRGHRSIQHLKENGVDTSKVISLGDPVLACDIKLRRTPKRLMGNVRSSPPSEVKHIPNEDVQERMAVIYDWLIEKYNKPLILVSFRHFRADNDVVGAQRTREKMKHSDKVTIFAPRNFREAMRHMRLATFWFGQRLHPAIFAGVQHIPFVGVEYQFEKMLDWISTVGIDNYIHTEDMTLDNFIERFDSVKRNMRRLRRNTPKIVSDIDDVARRIMELV